MNDHITTVEQLRRLVADFVARREWEQFHDPKNLAGSILIEAAELMEHFQWVRSDQLEAVLKDPGKMEQVREEVADVLAFLLAFANATQIDLASSLQAKMEKNAKKYPEDEFRGRFEIAPPDTP